MFLEVLRMGETMRLGEARDAPFGERRRRGFSFDGEELEGDIAEGHMAGDTGRVHRVRMTRLWSDWAEEG